MYYGITLTRSDGVVKNTTDDFHMAPSSRPLVNSPEVKTEYVDIPGANGSLDYTEILTGAPSYGMREGSWEFIVLNDPYIIVNRNGTPDNGWWELYHDLLEFLHGKYFSKIELESEPDRVYSGRLFLEGWNSEEGNSKVTIKYKINPMTKPRTVEVPDETNPGSGETVSVKEILPWKWNSLFGDYQILYGPFQVNGTMYRTITNSDSSDQSITIHCDAAMSCKKGIIFSYGSNGAVSGIDESGAQTIELPVGNTTLILPPGETIFKFTGYGKAEVYYGNVGESI